MTAVGDGQGPGPSAAGYHTLGLLLSHKPTHNDKAGRPARGSEPSINSSEQWFLPSFSEHSALTQETHVYVSESRLTKGMVGAEMTQ